MPSIHPTAIVHPAAELADDAEVGPYCVIESDVRIGPGCRLAEHVIVRRFTTLGKDNFIDAFTVLGGLPQDLKFSPATVSYLRIGDGNVFREGVTISRATKEGGATVVGSNTYWMTGAHAGHDSVVEDQTVLANGAAVAGHAVIGRGAILSSHVGVHQFCWVGELVIAQGNTGASMHVPPYTILANGINNIGGLNTVGLQRAKDLSDKDRAEIKEAFDMTYRRGLTRVKALAEMDSHTEWGQAAGKFRDFVRRVLTAKKPYNRGLCRLLKGD
jgi:UDP-N-acetylglucosamine acyltransferase